MKCTFCSFEFDEKKADDVCQGCLWVKKCGLIKCPRCHFELVLVPALVRETKEEDSKDVGREVLALNQLGINGQLQVVHIDTKDRLLLRKLIAIGVLPETKIKVIQRFPSYVLEIGNDRFTIDRELASAIYVEHIS